MKKKKAQKVKFSYGVLKYIMFKKANKDTSSSKSVNGVFYSFNSSTKTLVVNGADQELEVVSLPAKIAEGHEGALVVDVSGNRFVSLENFENFSNCHTLILDDNQLREESLVLIDGSVMRKVHTLCLNKNQIKDPKLLAINVANTFPNVRYLSILWNPCCPVNEGTEYTRLRALLVYKLPSLRFLDSRAVTSQEKAQAEVAFSKPVVTPSTASNTSSLADLAGKSDKGKEEQKKSESEEEESKPVLKKDSTQAELVRQARKEVQMRKSSSVSSIRKAAGLADTSAPGLVRASGRTSDASSTSTSTSTSTGTSQGPIALIGDDDDDDDDDSCLVGGQSDDSSEAPPSSGSKSKNLPMVRSVSLSGRKLEDHFQYAKAQVSGKIVDREGWLLIRLKKTRWKRCWFVLKGGALFRYRTPNDELFVEQIIISGSIV